MPLPDPVVPPTPYCHNAPVDVGAFLYSKGWSLNSTNNAWKNMRNEIAGYDFDWPEALAYEMFRTFVLLKTQDEA